MPSHPVTQNQTPHKSKAGGMPSHPAQTNPQPSPRSFAIKRLTFGAFGFSGSLIKNT